MLDLQKLAGNQKLVVTTAYDYTMAKLIDQANIDAVLVGDSLGMVVQGASDTLSVTVEDMIYHSRCVSAGLTRAHLIVDMPFMSYQVSVEDALRNAGRLVREGKAQSVKLEGGQQVVNQVRAIVAAGIPVVGHLGLTPQSVNSLGGYRVQGRSHEQQRTLIKDAKALVDAGISMLVLEMVPAPLASALQEYLSIPIIGIGAGPGCAGQVLVCTDLLGFDMGFSPRFLRRFQALEEHIVAGYNEYSVAVREGEFPAAEHSFGLRSDVVSVTETLDVQSDSKLEMVEGAVLRFQDTSENAHPDEPSITLKKLY